MENKAEITYIGFLDMQVCVPKEFTDYDAEAFANRSNPAGTSNGWMVRKEGDESLAGQPSRVPCSEREGCVHIMLDC